MGLRQGSAGSVPSDDGNHSQSEPGQEVGIEMSLRVFRRMIFWKKILPILILFSVSLVLLNAVYLYLSVYSDDKGSLTSSGPTDIDPVWATVSIILPDLDCVTDLLRNRSRQLR
ncbi:hypothetical protein PPACK8108_LOCUS20877 [Phakopsora pachyrhizi]|uniref:Uncharacterized protein n=1 Tax=Phakopsora pachyrhizi TaxID=170000 RepID=A0AAV0BL18_PHAPC|nr:hypothetical protein PPACK8108_LOCUS20877 [Phakopsora pachyrhizi]